MKIYQLIHLIIMKIINKILKWKKIIIYNVKIVIKGIIYNKYNKTLLKLNYKKCKKKRN
jgi:hypothetical protein